MPPRPHPLSRAQLLASRLRDLPGWWLSVEWVACTRVVAAPTELLVRRGLGDRVLGELLPRLTCEHCGARVRTAVMLDSYGGGDGHELLAIIVPLLP